MDGTGFRHHRQPSAQHGIAPLHGHDVARARNQPEDLREYRRTVDVEVEKRPMSDLRIRLIFQVVMFARVEHQGLAGQDACPDAVAVATAPCPIDGYLNGSGGATLLRNRLSVVTG